MNVQDTQTYINRHRGESVKSRINRVCDTPSILERDLEAYELGLSGQPLPPEMKDTTKEYCYRLGMAGLSLFDSFKESKICTQLYHS